MIGRVGRKPIGSYTYWKRRPDHFDLCRVKVYVLEVERQLPAWREKGQRQGAWFLVDDAADLVDDAGLVTILRGLDAVWPRKGARKAAEGPARPPANAGRRTAGRNPTRRAEASGRGPCHSSRYTRSCRSCRSCASTDSVAIGRASRRRSPMGSPVSSQKP